MITHLITVATNSSKEDIRITKEYSLRGHNYNHTLIYWGAYSYCLNLKIAHGISADINDENNHLHYNIQVGRFSSIGEALDIPIFRGHSLKSISTGACDIMLNNLGLTHENNAIFKFNQKSTVIIQNDVWIGKNVTIMPNVIIRNGAVVARNSHVVSDVPAYAIVGGNPAKIIGYRFTKEQIAKLQYIQWWYFDKKKISDNANYFLSENINAFCDKFYNTAFKEMLPLLEIHNSMAGKNDKYFLFVDFYENNNNLTEIIQQFIDTFGSNKNKSLILFIQDRDEYTIKEDFYSNLQSIIKNISTETLCTIKIYKGNKIKARNIFIECTHYIISRTHDAVYFSCLADLLNIEIIFGTDTNINFQKTRNMIKL